MPYFHNESTICLADTSGNVQDILLDYSNLFNNFGRLSFINKKGLENSIHSILQSTPKDYASLFANKGASNEESMAVFLLTVFLLKKGSEAYRPLNVLELGSKNANISYFLTKTSRQIHSQSRVHCVSEYLYDEKWLAILSMLGEDIANLSLLTMPPCSPCLKNNFFDFTLLNGQEPLSSPEDALNAAILHTKENGMLLCLPWQHPQLTVACLANGQSLKPYPLEGNEQLIYAGVVTKAMHEKAFAATQAGKAQNACRQINEIAASLSKDIPAEEQEASTLITMLQNIEDLGILTAYEINGFALKMAANEAKELILNYLYTESENQKQFCQSEYAKKHVSLLDLAKNLQSF